MFSIRARRAADILPSRSSVPAVQYNKTHGKAIGGWAAQRVVPVLVVAAAVAGVLLLWWILAPVIHSWRASQTPDVPSESSFELVGGGRAPFGSLLDPATLTLSVVVPAYNEEQRLPAMLDDMLGALDGLSRDAAEKWCVRLQPLHWCV